MRLQLVKLKGSVLSLSVIILTVLISTPNSYAAPGDPVGDEAQVNQYTDSFQGEPVIAIDADGDFTIVWTSEEQDGDVEGVFAKTYSTSGIAITPETQINTTTDDEQHKPGIAVNAEGDSLIVWQSLEPHVLPGQYQYEIYVRSYNNLGEFQFENLVGEDPGKDQISPAVAIDADGDFVVVWNDDVNGVHFQRYDSLGIAQGGATLVKMPGRIVHGIAVAMDAVGNYVVTWNESTPADAEYPDGKDGSIFIQQFDKSGTVFPSFIEIYENSQDHVDPDVAMNLDGDFVIVWTNLGESDDLGGHLDSPDGDGSSVFMHCYDALGASKTGASIQVNTFSDGDQGAPAIGIAADGSFVVAWDGDSKDGTGKGIFAQRFNADCSVKGEEFIVNTYKPGPQSQPDVAVDADGDFVITWQSLGQSGSDEEVFYQKFSGDSSIDLSLVADNGDIIFADVKEELEYTFTVTNNSASPDLSGNAGKDLYLSQVGAASGVTVKAELDETEGVTYDGFSGTDWRCNGDDINITCVYGGSLVPSASTTVTLFITMPEDPTKFAVTSDVSADQTDPDTSNNFFDVGVNISGSGSASGASMSWLLALFVLLPSFLRRLVMPFRLKKCKACSSGILATLCLLLASGNSHAIDYAVNASLSTKKMEFDRSTDTSTTNANFTMIGLTGTAILDNSYISLAAELPTSEEKSNDGTVVSDRDELSLTWGCNCVPYLTNVNFFVGYTSTGTDIVGSVPGEAFTENHTDKGLFVGGLVPVIDVDKKRISLALGYALLDGEIDFTDEFTGVSGTVNGDTTGFSYAVILAGSISETLNYSFAYKVQDYIFEGDFEGVAVDVDKRFSQVLGSVTYFF